MFATKIETQIANTLR